MVHRLLLLLALWCSGFAEVTPDTVVFAVIGDYGRAGADAAAVATMVKSWEPDFIITTGDNNYPVGAASTIDENIGQYYHDYIFPYNGSYGNGATVNRFFPTLGNHDWQTDAAQPYLDYFMLPGNERYYDFVRGPVHFFALSADFSEPDGISETSVQAEWLREQLAASAAPWQIVYMHLPPYSSGHHGSHIVVRWPFEVWGADAVISGHDHVYERIIRDGFPYFVNGAGGGGLYRFRTPVEGSAARYNRNYGAMRVDATETSLTFAFYSINDGGTLIDHFVLSR
ncbi:MAG: metallophosphoesterase [Chloroflexi bacterium]|nr:metallophosphoesterase [Chloroflexota bacterium]